MNPLVIEVPSPLGLRPSGLEHAPDALRRAGLHERLGCPDTVRIDVPPYSDVRDPETGILNPEGIAAAARDVAGAVDAALDSGRFPVLLGGDRSIVLGPMLALRRGLLTSDRARGVEVTIFNPRLDPDGSIARRLSDLIADSVLRGLASRTVPRLRIKTSRPERRTESRCHRLHAAVGLPHAARCEQLVRAELRPRAKAPRLAPPVTAPMFYADASVARHVQPNLVRRSIRAQCGNPW